MKSTDYLPLVTVYIPTHNRVDLLKRAVESVLTQTYKNIEVIIVDDGSTDGTGKYLSSLSVADQRLKFIVKERNQGAVKSRNIAIKRASGKFITGLDDDDYFTKNRIKNFIDFWKKNEKRKMPFIFSNSLYERNGGLRIKSIRPKAVSRRTLIHGNYIGNQVFAPAWIYRSLGGFDPDFFVWQDFELWFRFLGHGEALNTQCFDYVLDMDHGLERISDLEMEKKKASYKRFCDKYNLSSWERKVVYLQLYQYDYSGFPWASLLLNLCTWPSRWTIQKSFGVTARKLKSTIRKSFN